MEYHPSSVVVLIMAYDHEDNKQDSLGLNWAYACLRVGLPAPIQHSFCNGQTGNKVGINGSSTNECKASRCLGR